MDLTLFFGVVLAPTSSFFLDQRNANKSTLNNHFIKKLDLAVHQIKAAWANLLFWFRQLKFSGLSQAATHQRPYVEIDHLAWGLAVTFHHRNRPRHLGHASQTGGCAPPW